MGVMEKMRSSTGYILWVLIFSFGILWMLQQTNVFSVMGRAPRSLGTVNGERITFESFQARMQLRTRRYTQRTGNTVNSQTRALLQDRVWNQLVRATLIQQQMEQLGIVVTDREVVEMVRGENPVPLIQRLFGQKDGTINRVALRNAINAERNSQRWIAIEQRLREQRRLQKLTSFLQSAHQVTDYEVKQYYIRHHTTADIKYVRFPYANISKEDVKVTEEMLRTYYQQHQKQFKRKEQYHFIYVTFSKAPTAQDTARTIQRIKDLRDDFASAENDSLFLANHLSVVPYNPVFIDKDNLKPLFEPVLTIEEGEVTKVIHDHGQLYVLKKLEEKNGKVKFATLSFKIKADPVATIEKRRRQANDFKFFARKSGFRTEAKRRNLKIKEASATKGTLFIPGLGRSRQILDFLSSTEEGTISEPIETPNQFIVLKVTEIIPKGVRPFKEVKAQIRNIVFNRERKELAAKRVTELLKTTGSLKELAEAAGKKVVTMVNLRMSSTTIAGAGREPQVVGAVFGLKTGKVSGPIKGAAAVFVVKVTDKQKADPAEMTMAEAREIRRKLSSQKTMAFNQIWYTQLKKQAEIEDYRNLVLR